MLELELMIHKQMETLPEMTKNNLSSSALQMLKVMSFFLDLLIDWSIDRLIDGLVDWLIAVIDWLADW